jgi:hypothetical protein
MSDHDRTGRKNESTKAQGKRLGASVLVAAASLLGTSLGVSAVTMPDPQAPAAKDSTGSDAPGAKPERVAIETPKVNAPHVTITRPNIPSNNGSKTFQSVQGKDFQSVQGKDFQSVQGKDFQSFQGKDSQSFQGKDFQSFQGKDSQFKQDSFGAGSGKNLQSKQYKD